MDHGWLVQTQIHPELVSIDIYAIKQ